MATERKEAEIGKIIHYFGHVAVGIIELTAALAVGDKIHIKGAHDDFDQVVDSIQIEHQNVERAAAGDAVGVKVSGKVHEGDKVYQVLE
jgi:putative protease